MMQGAIEVLTWCNPWTTVIYRRVGQRNPTGQILLRLNIVIAVILMPRKILLRAGSLIYQLIPVQTYLRADEIQRQRLHHRVPRKASCLLRRHYCMGSKHDFIRAGDGRLARIYALQVSITLRFQWV